MESFYLEHKNQVKKHHIDLNVLQTEVCLPLQLQDGEVHLLVARHGETSQPSSWTLRVGARVF